MTDGSVKLARAANVTWASGNEKIAAVDADTGKITARKPGSTKVTGTAPGGASVSFNVNVVSSGKKLTKLAVKGVPKRLYVKKANPVQLKVSVGPASVTNVTIAYQSSNNKVLKVDACGRMTPAGKGNAHITVTAKGGGAKMTVKTRNIVVK
jgi:uncharacterized protein YjdB